MSRCLVEADQYVQIALGAKIVTSTELKHGEFADTSQRMQKSAISA